MSASSDGDADVYRLSPGVRLRVRGGRLVRRHFAREYGPAADHGRGPSAQVEIDLRWALAPRGEGVATVAGGHKTARWTAGLSEPGADPLRGSIALRGGPPSFALSLVQGYFVEPLTGLALSRSGEVLLPAAAIERDGGALLLIGRSRSGKSSLAARAIAAGRGVLGDDQVVIGPQGLCLPFPRRLRLYPDLEATAPAAHRGLPPAARVALAARRGGRALSRGYVAPPLLIAASALGARRPQRPLPIQRVAVIERSPQARELAALPLAADRMLDVARAVLDDQRLHLRAAGPAWEAALTAASDEDLSLMAAALGDLPLVRLAVPAAWEAPRAIAALERWLEAPWPVS